MRRALTAVLMVCLLSGCTETTISFSDGQFNGTSEPFPSNYRTSAAKAVAGLPVAPGQTLAVSYPQQTFGTTAIDPRRWFVCVRGLQPLSGAPDSQAMLVFTRFGTPFLVRTKIDDPCRNATGYQGLPRV